jgi:hypothetical protein
LKSGRGCNNCLTLEPFLFIGVNLSLKNYFMFDQILQLVKESLANHPAVTENMPQEQVDALHQEIATHVTNGLQAQAQPETQGASGSVLTQFENSLSSGNILTSAISGGLVGSLASKFGLPPLVTGAIAAALPGLMQKYMHKEGETAKAQIPAAT